MKKRPFKPQIYKSRGQNRSCNWESFHNKSNNRNRGQYTKSRPRQNYRDSNYQGNFKDMEDKIIEEDIEMIDIMIAIEVETGQEKGHSQETIVGVEIEVQVMVDAGQAPELAQTEIG